MALESCIETFIQNTTPTFVVGLILGFTVGGAMFSAIVTVSWVWYGERRCKECGKDPDFEEDEEI